MQQSQKAGRDLSLHRIKVISFYCCSGNSGLNPGIPDWSVWEHWSRSLERSSRNVVQQQEPESVCASCQPFSGHMVRHMALAGPCAWAGHRWWALDGQGGMQTSPLMALSYPTPAQGGLLALSSAVALFLGKWRERIAQRWLTPSLSWCHGLPLLPGGSQAPLPTGCEKLF